jgi:hypothetical protein
MRLISKTDLLKLDDRQLSALREEFRKAIGDTAEKTRKAQAALQDTQKAQAYRRILRLKFSWRLNL